MGLLSDLINENESTLPTLFIAFLIMTLVWLRNRNLNNSSTSSAQTCPPLVPYAIPFLGSAIAYGIDPLAFLKENYEKFGSCFTFIMMGRNMVLDCSIDKPPLTTTAPQTFCLGPEGNHFVFNVPLANASAEGAYEKLTVPVFGKEVVYDVDNAVFMEQKKFVKDTFSVTAFRKYISLIREETREFLKFFPDKGETVIFEEMSELTIRTASCCLMGKEIRSQLHSNVAKLYHDLDNGLAPINVFFRWLPLPVYFRRDKAHSIMTQTFKDIIVRRRANSETENSDVLQTLMTSTYKSGEKMSDDAIAHMMIATLMGGQHTSSTTTSWILFELAQRPDVVAEIIKEQSLILTNTSDTDPKALPEFDYDQLREMTYLDCVMKETLRLHPPIHTVMRKVEKDVSFKGYTIPAGHFLCGSQAFSQKDAGRFPDPERFEPSRFIDNAEGSGEWSLLTANVAQKSARSHFLPFGAGRHRCIGEAFAYVQIKSIISYFIREFEFGLREGHGVPKMDYTSLIVVPEKNSYLTFKRRV